MVKYITIDDYCLELLRVGDRPLVRLAAVHRQVRRVGALVTAVFQGPAIQRLARTVRLVAQVLVLLVADLYVGERPLLRLARLLLVVVR